MNVIDAILTRRSIRKYKDLHVNEEDIQTLLRCAMHAPSAGNAQPWHFVVIDDREVLMEIVRVHPYAKMLESASHAILVAADLSLEKYPDRWTLDCSAATQNILLAAHELGLGAVWIGIMPDESRVKNLINICKLPVNCMPVSLIALGYPSEEPKQADRFKPERIHRNRW